MKNKKYQIAIVIGRFQVLHNGHIEVLRKAFEVAEQVLIFIGSANSPRTIENPFNFEERGNLINRIIYNNDLNINLNDEEDQIVYGYEIIALNDYIYDDAKWKQQINNVIKNEASVVIVGGSKGEWYMDMFPEYDHIIPENISKLNATDIRESYFYHYIEDANKKIKFLVPKETYDFLMEFRNTKWYRYLAGEYGAIKDRLKKFGQGPFLTCDNIIMQDYKILLIKRKSHPGRGLWAVPGGFFDQNDFSWEEGCWRELKEETSLDLSFEKYKCLMYTQKIFDHPKRSYTRLISLTCHIKLPSHGKYHIQADDDASDVRWFTLEEIKNMKNVMYDDHWDQISIMIGFD